MPQRPITGPPNSHVEGDWLKGTPTSIEARRAQAFAANLAAAIGQRSMRSVGEQCGIHHTTISAVLAGSRWPDFVTIVRLETGLDASLWPTD